jgi:hypothetical protein
MNTIIKYDIIDKKKKKNNKYILYSTNYNVSFRDPNLNINKKNFDYGWKFA